MKGDFSRRTFDPAKHYSAVLQEQGRMLTEADLEEEHRILAHRIETEALDLIGGCGGPIDNAGFEIIAALLEAEIQIGPGRYYVDGILAEHDAEDPVPFSGQPHRPGIAWPDGDIDPPLKRIPDITGTAPGRYLAYLDVWRRLITAIDDPGIREVALNGPTTAAREQTIWQVRLLKVDDDASCLLNFPDDFGDELGKTTGMLAARATPEVAMTDPCEVPPGAGFKGLENQFYRVEIHNAGGAYDLASPDEFVITGFPAETNKLTLQDASGLHENDFVEVFRSSAGSDPVPGTFAQIVTKEAANTVVLSRTISGYSLDDAPKLRRLEATFVWSRDNGSVVTSIERIDGQKITVHDLGRDDVLGFAVDQWVEITDDRNDLEAEPGQLLRIVSIDRANRVITVQSDADALDSTQTEGVNPDWHPKLRRWDGAGGILVDGQNGNEVWISLEDGIQARFSGDADPHYRTDDYWHFPARTAIIDPKLGNIDWPLDDADNPIALPPHGVEHHYCKLAMVDLEIIDDNTVAVDEVVADCRHKFPPVTELTNLFYVGGDGQEAVPNIDGAPRPFKILDSPLEVRVANGSYPVEGAWVRFEIFDAGNGELHGTGNKVELVQTDSEGLASCRWRLNDAQWQTDDSVAVQRCEARLLNPYDNPQSDPPPVLLHQAVNFTATLSTAKRVSYDPSNCQVLADRNVRTVQEAIDELCKREGGRCCCVVIGPEGDFEDIFVAIQTLMEQGLRDICLCLMPGDHRLADLNHECKEPERPWNLSISGCGRGTRLHVEERLHATGLAGFSLRDLDITLQEKATIHATQCREVEIDNCHVSGLQPDVGLVRIDLASRIYVGNSNFEAFREHELPGAIEFFADTIPDLADIYHVFFWRDFEMKARELSRALADQSPDERRNMAGRIEERLRGMEGELSLGEANAYRRLFETLRLEQVDPLAIFDHLVAIRRAVLRVNPGVALEFGTIVPGPDDPFSGAGSRDGAAIIENNDITGLVSFYGIGLMDDAFNEILTEEILKVLDEILNEQPDDDDPQPARIRLRDLDLDVHVRDNRLTRFVVSGEIAKMIAEMLRLLQEEEREGALRLLYATFHCTNNVIDGARSQLIARHLPFTSNEFSLSAVRPREQRAQRVATVIGDTTIYTGNHGRRHGFGVTFNAQILDVTRATIDAANLELAIA